jgi:transcriptional regulator with GAF, ATPase, and Fis domain
MKRKIENIALSLLVIIFLFGVVQIIVEQQHVTHMLSEYEISELRVIAQNNSWVTIFFTVVSLVFSALMTILVFWASKKSKNNSEEIDFTTQVEEQQTYTNTEEKKEFAQLKLEHILTGLSQNSIQELGLHKYAEYLLTLVAKEYEIFQSIVYIKGEDQGLGDYLYIVGTYAFNKRNDFTLAMGEGLAGQVAKAKRLINIKQIPQGYIKAVSGLGELTPSNLMIVPLIIEDQTIGVIEISSFKEFSKEDEENFLELGAHVAPLFQQMI